MIVIILGNQGKPPLSRLLTMYRKLMVDMKRSRGTLLKYKTKVQLDQESSKTLC